MYLDRIGEDLIRFPNVPIGGDQRSPTRTRCLHAPRPLRQRPMDEDRRTGV